MYATRGCHFVFQQGIHHAVPSWLHLGLESLRHNVDPAHSVNKKLKDATKKCIPEVSLLGRASSHGFVVRMLVGIIEDLQRGWLQLLCDLQTLQCLLASELR